MNENEIARIAYGLAYKVHKALGPGLLESTYEECLYYELTKSGFYVERQKTLPLIYEEVKMELAFRLDLIVEKKFIIEIKSVEGLNDDHVAQVLTYLKLANCKLGFLINFNVKFFKYGLRRLINGDL